MFFLVYLHKSYIKVSENKNWIQRSVLAHLLFNIYLNELFFPFLQDSNICHFADGKTPFVCDETLGNFPEKLEGKLELAIFWFESNDMKVTYMIAWINIICGKGNVTSINTGSGGFGGTLSTPPPPRCSSMSLRVQSPIQRFLGSKEHRDWLEIDLNMVEIIFV